MSPSTAPTSPMPTVTSKATPKSAKPTKTVVLRLPTPLLERFVASTPAAKPSRSKLNASSSSSTSNIKADTTSQENASEPNATPIPDEVFEGEPPRSSTNPLKRKAGPGTKTGIAKKPTTAGETRGSAKSRGKSGTKNKCRPDGENNGALTTSWTVVNPLANHKVGPKANQGAINAGLRALDRTGRPCRRWQRNGFQLKSFTGHAWALPSWQTPKAIVNGFSGDVKSDTTPSTDSKVDLPSSIVESERSNSGNDTSAPVAPASFASSPIPAK